VKSAGFASVKKIGAGRKKDCFGSGWKKDCSRPGWKKDCFGPGWKKDCFEFKQRPIAIANHSQLSL
jgi:hypothetical protein